MTKLETYELLRAIGRLLDTHRAEAIQLSCGTGQSLDLARKTWLYSVLSESLYTGALLSIPPTPDFSKYISDLREEIVMEYSDA
jgi:hypothetical protein